MNVVTTLSPAGLKLTGEIDAANAYLVGWALREHAPASGSMHVDLGELSFCDVSGIREIVSYAETLDGDHRLVLHGVPLQIEKVMNVMGWAELPGLEFCACELET